MACVACADRPAGQSYQWPEQLAYRVDFVSQAQRNLQPMLHYAESKTMRMMTREGRHLIVNDSVLKSAQEASGVRLVPYELEDTLGYYVQLGPKGEISGLRLICDPGLPACGNALESVPAMELRRVIPPLPGGDLAAGMTWTDTFRFDEAARDRGTRGSVLTTYTVSRDTVLRGVTYQVIGWRASRQVYRRAEGAAIIAEPAVIEIGVTLLDRRNGLPALSSWAGTSAVPPDLRAVGATSSGFRGRAYLTGTHFDSLYSRSLMP